MHLADVEPDAAPWTVRPVATMVADLLAAAGSVTGRPLVVAVDGRSASGKSTLAERFATEVPGSAVVHTDDVAWWESFFGWDGLLADHVLRPVHAGDPVRFRPPAWVARNRPGAIEVPAGVALLVVEGVGVSRRSLAGWLDVVVWVQSDAVEARRRGVERDGADQEAEAFWEEWQAEEQPFLAGDRPWERAHAVVCGTPTQAGAPPTGADAVLVGRSLRA